MELQLWLGIHMQMAKRGAAFYSTAKRQIEELLGAKMVAESWF